MAGYIVKVTRHCNMRCTYCHEWRDFGESSTMEFDVLARLIVNALNDSNNVQFIWHGGEPLLAGKSFFAKAVALQESCKTNRHRISNTIQTNGLLLTEDWCNFLNELGFHVGVSIDGPMEVHDKARLNIAGQGTYRRVEHAISILNKTGLKYGALIVLNHQTLRIGARRILNWIVDLGISSFSLLPVRPDNRSQVDGAMIKHDYVTDEEYSKFMISLYDSWMDLGNPKVVIREIDSIRRVLHGSEATVCVLAGSCAGEYFGIEVDGSASHCDKYSEDAEFTLGNAAYEPIHVLRNSGVLKRIAAENHDFEKECKASCRWYGVCHGGCPHDNYIRRMYSSPEDGCCGQFALIEHIENSEYPWVGCRTKPSPKVGRNAFAYYVHSADEVICITEQMRLMRGVRALAVVGSPGLGKSFLLSQIATSVQSDVSVLLLKGTEPSEREEAISDAFRRASSDGRKRLILADEYDDPENVSMLIKMMEYDDVLVVTSNNLMLNRSAPSNMRVVYLAHPSVSCVEEWLSGLDPESKHDDRVRVARDLIDDNDGNWGKMLQSVSLAQSMSRGTVSS